MFKLVALLLLTTYAHAATPLVTADVEQAQEILATTPEWTQEDADAFKVCMVEAINDESGYEVDTFEAEDYCKRKY